MPDSSNKKSIFLFVVIFVAILAVLAVFIGYRLYTERSKIDEVITDANKTRIGGNIYCLKTDGSKGMVLNTGRIVISDTGTYPVGARPEDSIIAIPDELGSWSALVNWENTNARYNVSYEFDNTVKLLANGIRLSELKNKKALNCSSPLSIGSIDPNNSSKQNLKPACIEKGKDTSTNDVSVSEITASKNLCASESDKTSYIDCELNGAATDKKDGYRGFDFTFDGCGEPVSTDVQVKLSTSSVFLPSGEIELVVAVKNASSKKMEVTGQSAVKLNFLDTSNYLDEFNITCASVSGATECGKVSDMNKGIYEITSLEPGKEYLVILSGTLKSSLKLLDKLSMNVEAILSPGYLDTNYVDNKAVIEKTIIVDGKQCSDSKLAWDDATCWNNVKMNDDGFYYFDTCKAGETCDLSFNTLTENQLCMYLNWVNNSKPSVSACPQTVVISTSQTTAVATSVASTSLKTSSSTSSIVIVQLGSSSSRSSVSSSSRPSSSSSRSSISSATSSTAKLPGTAVEPIQIIAWAAIFLISFGFVSYRFFFKEVNYKKIDDIRFEMAKKTYLTKRTVGDNLAVNIRKVKWELNYNKNRLEMKIRKLFDKKG